MPNQIYGGFTKRMFSYIIDTMIGGALGTIVLKFSAAIAGGPFSLKVNSVVTMLIVLLYFTLMTYLNDGQTLGKMIFGLKVVSITGEKLDLLTVIIREFAGRYIHFFSFFVVLYFIAAFTPKKQNISDFFADTSVIDLEKLACYEAGELHKIKREPIVDEDAEPLQIV